jgi:hypothetical protein
VATGALVAPQVQCDFPCSGGFTARAGGAAARGAAQNYWEQLLIAAQVEAQPPAHQVPALPQAQAASTQRAPAHESRPLAFARRSTHPAGRAGSRPHATLLVPTRFSTLQLLLVLSMVAAKDLELCSSMRG